MVPEVNGEKEARVPVSPGVQKEEWRKVVYTAKQGSLEAGWAEEKHLVHRSSCDV